MIKNRKIRPFVRSVNRIKLAKMHDEKLSIDEMMQEFNISRSGIYAALQKYVYAE